MSASQNVVSAKSSGEVAEADPDRRPDDVVVGERVVDDGEDRVDDEDRDQRERREQEQVRRGAKSAASSEVLIVVTEGGAPRPARRESGRATDTWMRLDLLDQRVRCLDGVVRACWADTSLNSADSTALRTISLTSAFLGMVGTMSA